MIIQPLATSTPLLSTPCIGKLFITILRNQPSLPGPFHWEGVHANHPRLCRASSEIGSHPCWSQTKRMSLAVCLCKCASFTHPCSSHSNTTILLLSSVKSLKLLFHTFWPNYHNRLGNSSHPPSDWYMLVVIFNERLIWHPPNPPRS